MKLPFEPELEDQNEPWDVINQRFLEKKWLFLTKNDLANGQK